MPQILELAIDYLVFLGKLFAAIMLLLMIAFAGKALAADKPIPPPDCWPWWQCNNADKHLNHPNCKCWDGK